METQYPCVESNRSGTFTARISVDSKRYYLGNFSTAEEAYEKIVLFMKDKNLIFSKRNKPIKNLIGKKFHRLTVKAYSGIHKGGHCQEWICQCDCGNDLIVKGSNLKNGGTKSCGCFKMDSLMARVTKPDGWHSLGKVIAYYRANAKKRNLDFNLSREEFKKIAAQNCHYCGTEARYSFNRPNANGAYIYNGIDRKNPSVGYDVENSLPCCRICNRAKSDMEYNEFKQWILDIRKNNEQEF